MREYFLSLEQEYYGKASGSLVCLITFDYNYNDNNNYYIVC